MNVNTVLGFSIKSFDNTVTPYSICHKLENKALGLLKVHKTCKPEKHSDQQIWSVIPLRIIIYLKWSYFKKLFKQENSVYLKMIISCARFWGMWFSQFGEKHFKFLEYFFLYIFLNYICNSFLFFCCTFSINIHDGTGHIFLGALVLIVLSIHYIITF